MRRYSGAREKRAKTLISAYFLQLPLRFAWVEQDKFGAELCLKRDRTPSANVKRTESPPIGERGKANSYAYSRRKT
jgi:hypothetical protein